MKTNMDTNLLLNESPLVIIPSLAVMIGRNESIVLQQVHYWLKRSKHIKLNRKWVYLTYDQFVEQIPFLSKSTIRRAIKKLEDKGYLLSDNFNRLKIDKTKWYSINYENLNGVLIENAAEDNTRVGEEQSPSNSEQVECSDETVEMPKVDCPPTQHEQSSDSAWHVEEFNLNTPIPENTTESTTKSTSETSSSSKDVMQNEVKEDPYHFFEQNGFGTIGGFMADKIKAWCHDLSDELVIEAMKIAVENSSKRWSYVEAVLRDWLDKGHQSLEDVHAARLAYKNQMKHQSRKKPIRQEYIPDWVHNHHKETQPEPSPSFEEKKRLFEERKKMMSMSDESVR